MNDEFATLVEEYLAGEIEADGSKRLAAIVDSDDRAADAFARIYSQHRQMNHLLGEASGESLASGVMDEIGRERSEFVRGAMDRIKSGAGRPITRSYSRVVGNRRVFVTGLAAATAVAATIALVIFATSDDATPTNVASTSDRPPSVVPADEPRHEKVTARSRDDSSRDSIVARHAPRDTGAVGRETPTKTAGDGSEETLVIDRDREPVDVVAPPTVAMAHLGYLDYIRGDVEKAAGKNAKWLRTVAGAALQDGERLRTKLAHARVMFDSGTVLSVGPFTTMTFGCSDGARGLYVLGGDVFIETGRDEPGLVVETPHGVSSHVGTQFAVSAKPQGTTVIVIEGSVRASTDEGVVEVKADHEVLLAGPKSPPSRPKRALHLRTRLAWVSKCGAPNLVRTVTFRHGAQPVSRYAGASDTHIVEDQPERPRGDAQVMVADGSGSGGKREAILLRWDLSSIPRGTRLRAASIVLDIADVASAEYGVYALKRPWDEASATWLGPNERERWQEPGALGMLDRHGEILGTISAPQKGPLTVPLNANGVRVIQQWIDNPASNCGLVISGPSNNGVDMYSRDSKHTERRPALTLHVVPSGGAR